jgi:glutamine amidotransferase
MIGVIDYKVGNLGSVCNMLRYLRIEHMIVDNKHDLNRASGLILPGVGAFDGAVKALHASGLWDELTDLVLHHRKPVLGICLGMQLLTKSSEEGTLAGLGWIDAVTKRLPAGPGLKIPHMGWNQVAIKKKSLLTKYLPENSKFYFVHSYYVKLENPDDRLLTATYGLEFDVGLERDNIFGLQFHPEKSHRYGFAVLKAFSEIACLR